MKILINEKQAGTKVFISWDRLSVGLAIEAGIKDNERIEAVEVDSQGITVVVETAKDEPIDDGLLDYCPNCDKKYDELDRPDQDCHRCGHIAYTSPQF